MTMTRAEYESAKAGIEEAWPKAQFPGMHGVMLDELEAQYADAQKPTVPNARQREYNDLHWQATLAGKDPAEADRLARGELARRHGEVDLDSMSLAELQRHAETVDVPDAWDPDRANRPEADDRSIEELAAALRAADAASVEDEAEHRDWAEGLADRIRAKSQVLDLSSNEVYEEVQRDANRAKALPKG